MVETITPTIRPEPKQELAWDALSFDNAEDKIIFFGGGAGGGKTWLGCEWLLTNCYRLPNSRWFMARNELKRLKQSTFVTFKKVCRHHQIPDADWHLDGQNNVIVFRNGATIDLLDVAFKPTDPQYERFGSLEYTGGFAEEGGEWHFDAFDILKSRIGRHNFFNVSTNSMCERSLTKDPNVVEIPPKLLVTCNPSRGWLYRTAYEPWKKGTLPKGYVFIQVLYSDNSYTADSYGEQLSGIVNKVNRARLKDGDWEFTDSINDMTTLEHLQDMFSATVVSSGERYITVDVATKEGEDATVVTLWDDLRVEEVIKRHKQSTDVTAQFVKDLAAAKGVPWSRIAVDAIGAGVGVADQLNGCVAFNSNSHAFLTKNQIRDCKSRVSESILPNPSTLYANLKTQCAFKLAELINDHKVSCAEVGEYRDEIIADLTATLQERDIDKDGKKKMITKEDIKAELGRSPDVGDTFLMRMFWVLKNDALAKDPTENRIVTAAQSGRLKMNMAVPERNTSR